MSFTVEKTSTTTTTIEQPAKKLSYLTYNLIIATTLIYGFFMNWFIVTNVPTSVVESIPKWLFIIGYFVSAIIGQMIYENSNKPIFSFIGYNLIVLPVSLLILPAMNKIDPQLIYDSILTTTFSVGVIMILATIKPQWFVKSINAASYSLLFIILIMIGCHVFDIVQPSIFNWIILIIMTVYIGFYWAKASQEERTVDNAIDGAANLYLPIINFFLSSLNTK